MINVKAKPFRMIVSGNHEKLNRKLIACFVLALGIRAPGRREAYAAKKALYFGLCICMP